MSELNLEELQCRPMSTRLVPMWSDGQPDTFGVLLQFPDGTSNAWQFVAPKLPITEQWIAGALRNLISKIMGDLVYGWSEPEVKRNPKMWEATNHQSLTGALHRMIHDWKDWRVEHYRKISRPATDFAEDPDADTGVDSGFRQPHERKKANGPDV